MKYLKLLGLMAIFFSSALAKAESYRYDCKLMTDYSISMEIEVSEKNMKFFDQYDGLGSGTRGTVVFDNNGIQGGKGKMKDRLRFNCDYDKSEVTPGEISEYFVSPEMIKGGLKLRNGSNGGFVSFAGHGYSWETYVCFAKAAR